MKEIGRLWGRIVLVVMRGAFFLASRVRRLPGGVRPEGIRSVVIFSTAGIGDVLSDTPAIRAVKQSFSGSRVAVVVHARRMPVLEHNPYIDDLIPHRKGPVAFFRTLGRIRRTRPDVAIVLRANDPDIFPLAFLSGAREVVGQPQRTRFPFLISRAVEVPDREALHGVEQSLRVVRAIGAETADPSLVFRVDDPARDAVDARLKELDLDKRPLVAMQIRASRRMDFRDWPADHFQELGRRILADHEVTLVLTGGREDAAKAEGVARGLGGRAVVLAGRVSLRGTAALLERCLALVTTDTGIMHLGFAVGTPTLALLHPFNAHRVGPYPGGPPHRTVVLEPLPGTPDLRPMRDLHPERVYEAFRDLFAGRRP